MDVIERYAEVEHVGGPYNGRTVRIRMDADGNPPELYTLDDLEPIDTSVDPAKGPQSKIRTHFYERDVATRGDNVVWVYRWTAETLGEAA